MAPIDPRLYKPERTTVIHNATQGTAEHFSKLGWEKGKGEGALNSGWNSLFQKKRKKVPTGLAVLLPLSFYKYVSILITRAYISSLLYIRKTLYNDTMLAYISFYYVRWIDALYDARYLY